MTESMTPSRDIREITAEIRTIQDSVRRTALSGAIEIGRRLTEAKELLQHGEWGDWLKREFEFSQSTASRLMQLFREYGADQGSLFGAETKYATLQNISVSNALRLIAIPDEEREEFAAEHDIEHKSAREVDELIRQRQEADARAAAAEKALADADEGHALAMAELDERLHSAQQAERDAKSIAETANARVKALAAERDKTAAELEELRSRPIEVAVQVDEEAVKKAAEEAKAEAERKAKAKHEKLEKKLTAATQELEAYKDGDNKELEQSRARAAALEKELAEERERARKAAELQDADVSAFGVHFVNVQRDFNDLLVALNKVRAAAPETGEKLTSAVRALVEKIGGTL
nr:MAG TPA: Protein of unknown function (DUF3102) [Caudoviricetes sp.]